jgi:recombination protein RecA
LYENVLAPRERKVAKSVVLAHLAETPHLAGVIAASQLEARSAPLTVSFGVASLDALTGGLPRGGLTEIAGPASSGRASVLLAALAAATQRGEICALIDAADAFDPGSGAAAGINFDRLLWVRCTGTAQQNDAANPLAKLKPAHAAQDFRSARRSSPDALIAPASRPARREPRPSRQLRESRDGYVTAPTYRAAPDGEGVRNFFQSPSDSRARAIAAQPDLFVSAKQQLLFENASAEDPITVWKRRLMEDPVEQALRATDLLLQSGGFGMIAIDLGGIPVRTARRIPLATWFRFRRVIEPTSTAMLLIDECACAQTCASLSLQMAGQEPSLGGSRWPMDHMPHAAQSTQLVAFPQSLQRRQKLAPHFSAGSARLSNPESASADDTPSHAHLLEGLSLRAELLRARTERKPMQSATTFASKTAWTG